MSSNREKKGLGEVGVIDLNGLECLETAWTFVVAGPGVTFPAQGVADRDPLQATPRAGGFRLGAPLHTVGLGRYLLGVLTHLDALPPNHFLILGLRCILRHSQGGNGWAHRPRPAMRASISRACRYVLLEYAA